MSSVLVEIKECLILAIILFLSPFALYGVGYFLKAGGLLDLACASMVIAYFIALCPYWH